MVAGLLCGLAAVPGRKMDDKSVPGYPAGPDVVIDFARSAGKFKPLNGVNGGPFHYASQQIPIEGYHARAGFTSTRLHDANWPHPDAVDINTIFPLFNADADDPANYAFAKTDDYLLPIVRNGSAIIYRLGVSIEHKTRYFIDPPRNYEKWAKICVNIIRHYNEGWANGHHYNIKYWEIWNEPEGKAMWLGTTAQYLQLYGVTARAIKAHDPSLKVGGPASTGALSPLMKPFLAYCHDNSLPLDFCSWHLYSYRVADYVRNTGIVRNMLDEYGFTNTQSFLDEWHFIPAWSALSPKDSLDTSVEKSFAATIAGEGAAFSAAVLMQLQDHPVDVMNFYCADYSPWSMFDVFGVPGKVYFAFLAYHQLTQLPERIICTKAAADSTLTVAASRSANRNEAAVLISNVGKTARSFSAALRNIYGSGKIKLEMYTVDETHQLSLTDHRELSDPSLLTLNLAPESVSLVKLVRSK